MGETLEDVGIYTNIYKTDQKNKSGHALYHVKCMVCEQDLYYPLDSIRRNHIQCRHVKDNLENGLGIYKDIKESGNKTNDGHKLYYATCSICNELVEKPLADLKRNNTICYHRSGYYQSATRKINDMPEGWINRSKLNLRIYDMWKAMLARTTEKYWEQYPSYTGATVDDRWRVLSNFVNDIKELDGYKEWCMAENREMMIDKDTIIEGNKHYSKDTCRFISHTESNQDVAKRHPENIQKAQKASKELSSNPVVFTNVITNEIINFSSLNEGCRALKLNFRNAWMVLSDKYPENHTVKGWTITKI